MDAQEYIEKLLKAEIDWYDRKSLQDQKELKTLRTAEIVAAALVPLLSGIAISLHSLNTAGSITVGLLGVAITVLAGTLSLGQHQEHWIEYRTTCESLKKEKFLFETRVEPYDTADAVRMLVRRVETLVSKENTNWAQYLMKPEQGKKDAKT